MTEHLTDDHVAALRARTVPVMDAFALLEHAAACRECSQRVVSDEQTRVEMAGFRRVLQGAVGHLSLQDTNDVVDGQVEHGDAERINAHLETCDLCRADVAAVRSVAAREQITPLGARAGSLAGSKAFFTTHRMLLTTSLVLAMAGTSGWLILRARSLRNEVEDARKNEVATSHTDPGAKRAGGPPSPETANPPEDRPNPPQTKHPSVQRASTLAVMLLPGIARGSSAIEPVIRLPAQVDLLKLGLKSRVELTAGRYTVQLTAASGPALWRKQLAYKSPPEAITVLVPASLLQPGRYVIALTATGDGPDETLAEYTFRIVR